MEPSLPFLARVVRQELCCGECSQLLAGRWSRCPALFVMMPPSFSSPQPCAGGFGVPGTQLPLGCLLHPAVGVFQRDLGAALSMSICSLVEHHFCTLSTVTLTVSFPEAVKNTHAGFFFCREEFFGDYIFVLVETRCKQMPVSNVLARASCDASVL